MKVQIPIRVISEANQSEHWTAKYKRKKQQQQDFRLLFRVQAVPIPCRVRFTRIAPRPLDSDNLVGAFKHVRDEFARIIRVDDGDPRVEYVYAQEKGKPKEYAIRVEVTPK